MEDLHKGHRSRLRLRFINNGLDSFEPHVVLEMLLFYAVPRGDTNPVAHRLIQHFGSLSGVFEASYEELLKVKGVGPASAVLLKMIPSVARLYLSDKFDDGIVLDTTQKRGAYILPRFIGKNKEQLYALLLDKKHKLLACVLLTEGSLDAVGVDVRAIAEAAIRVSASSVVLAHNHTHGFAIPSDADWSVTRHVSQTLKAISIELIDHIVVARDDFVSMADSGLLAIC